MPMFCPSQLVYQQDDEWIYSCENCTTHKFKSFTFASAQTTGGCGVSPSCFNSVARGIASLFVPEIRDEGIRPSRTDVALGFNPDVVTVLDSVDLKIPGSGRLIRSFLIRIATPDGDSYEHLVGFDLGQVADADVPEAVVVDDATYPYLVILRRPDDAREFGVVLINPALP